MTATTPDPAALMAALDATWPAAETRTLGPFLLRRGLGGGSRVSSATTKAADAEEEAIAAAVATMEAWNQRPLFRLTRANGALDARLEALGWQVKDPTVAMAGPVEQAAAVDTTPHDGIPCDPPLALQRAFWADHGVGPARLAVMERVRGPRTHLIARHRDQPGAAAFVAVAGEIAMLHALVVAPQHRRSGVARRLVARAALWAAERGARHLAVVTTSENLPARKLFSGLGLRVVENYHYRTRQGQDRPG